MSQLFIIRHLIRQQAKEAMRSILRYRNLAANIVFSLLMTLLTLNFLSIGLFIDLFLKQAFPGQNPVTLMNGMILYYLASDLFLRFTFQRIPSQSIEPYLHLPVKRSSLSHFLLAKSTLSFFNLLPLFIIIPFAVKVLTIAWSPFSAVIWIIAVVLLILTNSFINFYFQKQMMANPIQFAVYAIALIVILLLDVNRVLEIRELSALCFGYVLQNPWTVLTPLSLFLLVYLLNLQFLRKHLYAAEFSQRKRKGLLAASGFRSLEKFGEVGDYISLELRMFLRNKRSRSSVYLALFTLVFCILYSIYFMSFEDDLYPAPPPDSYSVLSVAGHSENYDPNKKIVAFRVLAKRIPPGAHIYITGNHAELGEWQTAKKPLTMAPDSSWVRIIAVDKSVKLNYKFTLGRWDSERLQEDGQAPVNYYLKVNNDTTLVHHVTRWKIPTRSFIIDFNLIYFGMMITGILMLVYGQFMLAWESGYWDAIISRKVNFEKYFKAKFILLISAGTLFYLLSLPLGLFNPRAILYNTALFIYNIGVNSFVLLTMCTFARKRLDLNASMYSTQGKSAGQYLTVLPTFILPLIISLPFYFLNATNWAFAFFAALGIFGLLFHQALLKMILNLFSKQKYEMAYGFRQK